MMAGMPMSALRGRAWTLCAVIGVLALAIALGRPHAVTAQTPAMPLPAGAIPVGIAIDAEGGRIYVANSARDTLSIIDAASAAVIGTVSTGRGPGLVIFDPFTKRVYVSNFRDASVTVVDATAPLAAAAPKPPVGIVGPNAAAVLATLPVGGLGLALNPATKKIYAASGGSLAVIDAVSNTVVAQVRAPAAANLWGVAVDATANRVYLTDLQAPRLLVFDGAKDSFVGEIPISGPARFGIAVSADGARVYAASYVTDNARISVIDAASGRTRATVRVGGLPFALALDEGRGLLFASNLGDGTVSAIRLSSNSIESTKVAGRAPAGLAVSGGRLYVVSTGDERLVVDP